MLINVHKRHVTPCLKCAHQRNENNENNITMNELFYNTIKLLNNDVVRQKFNFLSTD